MSFTPPSAASIQRIAILAVALNLIPAARAAESFTTLWQIGKPDRDDREFALAPNQYSQFKQDGFYVVGKSDARRDWPYVQPGPADSWAGGRRHDFTILFGLGKAASGGECRLRLDLADTQNQSAPKVQVSLNGHRVDQQLPSGGGDASIFGEPGKGKPCSVQFT